MAEKPQANADKLKVLSAVMDKIEKDFGKGSIMRMNSSEIVDVPVIPTGSITLDMALGVDYGVIKKSGSWFSYGDRKLGQGRDAVKELFKTDTALADEIETKVREAMKAPQQK